MFLLSHIPDLPPQTPAGDFESSFALPHGDLMYYRRQPVYGRRRLEDSITGLLRLRCLEAGSLDRVVTGVPWAMVRRKKCVHGKHLELLETLQKQTQKEIRTNVSLATGSHLPAELAELVYEAAVELEGIPADPLVHDYGVRPPSHRFPTVVRSVYRCATMGEYGRCLRRR